MAIKVVVVQLATPNIDPYAVYSVASVAQYCKMHGYRHLVQRSKTVKDMHINWTKIDLLIEASHLEADYIVLFDADAVIADHQQSIESFIERYAKANTEIMMPRGTYFAIGARKKRRPPRKIRPNAGFIILKNSEIGKAIVQEWMDAARGEGSIFNDLHPRNQLVYWNFVMPKYLDQQVILPDRTSSNAKNSVLKIFSPTPFLYHIMMSDENRRIVKMGEIFEKFNDQSLLESTKRQLETCPEGLVEFKTGNDHE